MRLFLLPWYEYIVSHGGYFALGEKFSNYAPSYLYLLATITYLDNIIPPVVGIKLISILFDFGLATIAHEIIRLKYRVGYMPLFALAAILFAPTIILNSAYWGQADSIYMTFLLACLYLFFRQRPFYAILAFSIALSLKLQAAFLFPVILILTIRGLIPWLYTIIPAFVFFILSVPAALLGRPLIDLLTIYAQQSAYYEDLSAFAPNLYVFCVFQADLCTRRSVTHLAFLFAAIGVVGLVGLFSNRRFSLSNDLLLSASTLTVALTPFLLPKMHDRYFYPADVFSIILAFYQPQLWWLPIMFQVSSLLAYSGHLWGTSVIAVMPGALINFTLILFLIIFSIKQLHKSELPNS
jgi:Gpi18-like mannosyltransferase